MLIDWHDFVVVETIGFEDEEESLPAPQELGPSDAQKEKEKAAQEKAQQQGAAEEPAEGAGAAEAEADEVAPAPIAVPEGLIRKNYVPQVGAKAAGSAAHYAVDPLTGQQVKYDEMEEHMRISLLDPKWKEQKQL